MKTITITVDVDGNDVSRKYSFDTNVDWAFEIEGMLETLMKSKEEKF